MTKKWQKKMQFCRWQKLHFLEALSFFCRFLVIFLSFFEEFSIFFHFLTKLHQNHQKWQKNDKKMTQKNAILQMAKIAFFSKHGHFFVVFGHFSVIFRRIFDIFPFFNQIAPKSPKWQKNDRKMTKKMQFCRWQKLHFSRSIVIFLSFFCHFCHFSKNFPCFSKIFEKWQKNDRKMTEKRQKNDNASRKMQFLPSAKLHFFWPFFCHCSVIFSVIFGDFGAI